MIGSKKRTILMIVFSLFALSTFFLLLLKKKPEEETNEQMFIMEGSDDANQENDKEEATEENDWIVDIKGAVKQPGVYEVTNMHRIIDVIELAGGLTEEANEYAINLAEKVMDEMVIYIPTNDEDVEDIDRFVIEQTGRNQEGKIHINKATVEEITSLNGIGPKKAEAIIKYREENGLFQEIDDLLEVSGIGEKTLENFREEIIVP